MAEIIEHGFSALFLRNGGTGGIQPELYGEIPIHGFPPEQLSHGESGGFPVTAPRQGNGRGGKYLAVPGQKPAAHGFQQGIRAIYDALRRAGLQADILRIRVPLKRAAVQAIRQKFKQDKKALRLGLLLQAEGRKGENVS